MIRYVFVVIFAIVAFSSCKKDPEHMVRIENQFPDTILSAKIGPVNYGDIAPNSITEFREVVNGHNPIEGTFAITDSVLSGTVSINGNGEQRFTVKINAAGEKTILMEK